MSDEIDITINQPTEEHTMANSEVLTAMDVVLRLEKKVDVVLADHEARVRHLETESAANRVVAAALADDKKARTDSTTVKLDRTQKGVIAVIAATQLMLTILTLGPDIWSVGP